MNKESYFLVKDRSRLPLPDQLKLYCSLSNPNLSYTLLHKRWKLKYSRSLPRTMSFSRENLRVSNSILRSRVGFIFFLLPIFLHGLKSLNIEKLISGSSFLLSRQLLSRFQYLVRGIISDNKPCWILKHLKVSFKRFSSNPYLNSNISMFYHYSGFFSYVVNRQTK